MNDQQRKHIEGKQNGAELSLPLWARLMLGLLAIVGLYLISRSNFLLFHSLAEGLPVVVATLVFVITVNNARYLRGGFLILIGTAYLYVGSLDLLHLLAYKGMGVFRNNAADLPTQLWIAGRAMESISFVLGLLLIRRQLRFAPIFLAYLVVTILLLASIFVWKIFPRCYIEGQGLTVFKKAAEYLIVGVLLAAIVLLRRNRATFDPKISRLLQASLVFTALAEIMFTFYISVYGLSNVLGHLFKIVSYILVYQAVVESSIRHPQQLIFRELAIQQEKLKRSEKRYRDLVQNIHSGVAVFEAVEDGRDFILTDLNASGGRINHVQPDAVVGRGIREAFPWMDENGRLEMLRRVRISGKPEYHPETVLHAGDAPTWRECFVYRLESGEVVAVFDDITSRKRAEAERSLLARALEQVDEGIMITDAEANIRYVNQAFSRITGYSPETMDAQNARILKDGQTEHSVYATMWQTIRSGRSWRGRVANRRRDGSEYQAELSVSPIRNSDREITHYIAVHKDITQELRQERELRERQKLEAIGTLSGGIAHDFNNLLMAIIGYTEIAKRRLGAHVEETQFLDQVLKAGFRARNLVERILAFSRKTEEGLRPTDLMVLIEETLALLKASLPATIEIRNHLQGQVGVIPADPSQIHQVLMNVCTNAGHAMQENGGVLSIELEEISLEGQSYPHEPVLSPGRYARISISDTGIGMSAELRSRIFEPFFTTKEPGKGTGLGLSMAHGIVESHGGAITVYSEPGEGSTFRIYLPVAEDHDLQPKDPDNDEQGLQQGTERILFIDDEPSIADLGKNLLQGLGYTVVTRTSSVEALELFRAKPQDFDLVITDMTMPQLTGDRLSVELQRLRPGLPIIMATGFSERITEQKAKALGINAFVMKPFLTHQIAATIRRVLDGKRQDSLAQSQDPQQTL